MQKEKKKKRNKKKQIHLFHLYTIYLTFFILWLHFSVGAFDQNLHAIPFSFSSVAFLISFHLFALLCSFSFIKWYLLSDCAKVKHKWSSWKCTKIVFNFIISLFFAFCLPFVDSAVNENCSECWLWNKML